MIEPDTIRLLRECDAGIKMGLSSIDEVLPDVTKDDFKKVLTKSRDHHAKLADKIESLLHSYGDDGKEPNPMAKGMSWMKTNVKISLDHSDKTIAGLLTDGCNMGIKSLSKYLNQYAAADEESKDITKKLIDIETQLVQDLRDYL